MEFTNTEAKAIEQTTTDANQQCAGELNELQLAFVSGGNIIINFG